MPRRIVVSFCRRPPTEGAALDRYVARMLALKGRAEALGARLCAFGSAGFAVDFDPADRDEAFSLASAATEDEPAADRFGIGVAEGELTRLRDSGSLEALSWGAALAVAESLAAEAKPGEVRVDPASLPRAAGEALQPISSTGPLSRNSTDMLAASQRFRRSASRAVAQACRSEGASALGRDQPESAVHAFHRAREATGEASARDSVGLGLAHAALGQMHEAVIEALSALAEARRRGDGRAEGFAAYVLAEQAAASGETGASAAWAGVAKRFAG
jgi:hypothetical protein